MKAGSIADKLAVSANDSMTGNDDADGITIVGHSHRSCGLGTADRLSKLRIASRLPIGNLAKSTPNLLLKVSTLGLKGKVELLAPTRQELLQLI